MANNKSAEKRNKTNEKRRQRNQSQNSRLRTFLNKFEAAIASGDVAAAEERFRLMESELHSAAGKGIIPRERASRKTGRLAVRLNALRTAQA